MVNRTLGQSGIAISPMGMGCWSYGGGAYWGAQSQKDVNDVVAAALDRGLNFFDTAEMYNDGASELSLGEALKGKRDKAVVSTKIGPAFCKRKLLFEHCDASLKRLQMDYVDCYMLHWPLNPVSLKHFTSDPALLADPPTAEETFSGLEELKKQGKIRSIGVSNFGRKQLEEALKTGVQIDVNEITYNLLSRAIEKDILPFCIENGISVVGSMALQQGLLAGIYKTPESVPAAQAHSRHFSAARGGEQSRHTGPGAEKEVFDAISAIQKIAQEQQMHIAQLAIAWVLEKQGVAATLVGSRNLSELESNIRAAGVTLSADVVSELDRVSRPVLEALGYNADYYEDEQNSRIF